MITKIRFWIVNLLVGDYSYCKNTIFIEGRLLIRPLAYISCCTFLNGAKLEREKNDKLD